jgi:hypothetical protein
MPWVVGASAAKKKKLIMTQVEISIHIPSALITNN